MKYYQKYASPLGEIRMFSDGKVLLRLDFEQYRFFEEKWMDKAEEKDLKVFQETRKWLDLYFQGKNPDFMPDFSLSGSDFQMRVWQKLLQIPYGQVVSYGELARQIAEEKGIAKMSAQAVGGAVGRNPISLIVPCHRVIGKDGSLVGYGGGLERKVALLELEKGQKNETL